MDPEQRRERLIESLRREGLLSQETEAAFRAVPREEFVGAAYRHHAYQDTALPLDTGATISQPSMIAIMLHELDVRPGMHVLEVGSGGGYLLALLAAMGAKPTGVEIIPSLAETSAETLQHLGIDAEVIAGNAEDIDFEGEFDRVVFSAALRELPLWAVDVLAEGGFVLAPVGDRYQQELVRAYAGRTEHTGRLCRFVPFIESR